MKDKETEYSAPTVGTNWGWLVCERIRAISPSKILFGFYIRLESLDFYVYFFPIEDHQLSATSLNKDPDQLKSCGFSGKCCKYSKNLIRFLFLSSRF